MTETSLPPRGSVLFADDERAARDGVAQLLRRRGFACVCVDSGTEALAQLQTAEFDALISDIHMPGNVGLELIASVPQIAAGLPVILLTGRPSVETAARSVRLAVAAYLTKPPDLDELGSILDQTIASYRGFRAMHEGRQRLQQWDEELAAVEQTLRRGADARPDGPMASFLRVTLRHVILTLSDVERAASALEQRGPGRSALEQVDLVAALRRTVEVLERTKRNFKSKDLAELRRELENLLGRTHPDQPPAPPAA